MLRSLFLLPALCLIVPLLPDMRQTAQASTLAEKGLAAYAASME